MFALLLLLNFQKSETLSRLAGAYTMVLCTMLLPFVVLPGLVACATLQPPWPYTGFSVFPALWFGANATGLDSTAQLALIARHSIAGYGWQQNANTSDFRHMESNGEAAAVHLRDTVGPSMPIFVYRHMQMAWSGWDVQRPIAESLPQYAGMLVKDANTSAICLQSVPGGQTPSPLYLWLNASAGQFWLEQVTQELIGEAGISAVFHDETDWSYCGYNFAKDGCTSVDEGQLLSDYRAKWGVLQSVAQALNAGGLWPIFSSKNLQAAAWKGIPAPVKQPCLLPMDGYVSALSGLGWMRFYEYWMGQGALLDAATIANALIEGGQGIPIIARAQASTPCSPNSTTDNDPTLAYALAAFFIVQEPYSYFGFSSGWYDSDWCWHAEYDIYACGQPVGPADRTGPYSWTRQFQHCNVAVNTSTASGSVVVT